MVLVKNFNFSMFFIFGKINQQNVFGVILESQKAFLDYKKQKVKKVEESGFFQRGWSMVLVKNLQFFSSFYFGLNRLEKCFCCYSRKEKGVFLTLKSQS